MQQTRTTHNTTTSDSISRKKTQGLIEVLENTFDVIEKVMGFIFITSLVLIASATLITMFTLATWGL